jgi:5'-AMP-activated protein kinase catalytic alpha subunit
LVRKLLFIEDKTIGEGTFGKVKLGYHLITNEKVAIKILEKSKIADSEDLERIQREIGFLKKLNHVNVIKVYEIIENAKYYYLIMEYASGGELFNYIVTNKRLEEADASFFFAQIIHGLEYIHKNGIVHR